MTHTIPVLIVGAGPTGLTVAACLTRYNIPFSYHQSKQLKPARTSNAIAVPSTYTGIVGKYLGLTDYALNRTRQTSPWHVCLCRK